MAERLTEILADQAFAELPISAAPARRAGLLPGIHRDPFDRMLSAQAQIEELTLVSDEQLFDTCGVHRLWAGDAGG